MLFFRRKALMVQQNFRCAGCGMAVAPGEYFALLVAFTIINDVKWTHLDISSKQ